MTRTLSGTFLSGETENSRVLVWRVLVSLYMCGWVAYRPGFSDFPSNSKHESGGKCEKPASLTFRQT
eukprot:2287368-Lingulodinium_polyedra.AAC.1